ncbi:MAG: DUF6498-containing protein [Micavibrio sp.]|nr:DUF6498-containing protein [Micavibrio sp.]
MQLNAFHAPPFIRLLLLLVFNLLPLGFVLAGHGMPFAVMAFYWVEVIAFGLAALLKVSCVIGWRLLRRGGRAAFTALCAVFLLPLHFGFFMVMTCFLVGSFLPAGEATRKLTSPLVPMEMVLAHINFPLLLAVAGSFRAADFFLRFLPQRQYEGDVQKPVLEAYGHLGILFLAGFFGLLLAMLADDRIWGVLLLVGFKTTADVIVLRMDIARRPAHNATL